MTSGSSQLIWNLDNFAELHTDDVEWCPVDAVLFGLPDDGDATIWEFQELSYREPTSWFIVVLVDDVTRLDVGHSDLHDLDDRSLHVSQSVVGSQT